MNDRITLTEIFEAFAGYGPAVWLGVLAAIVTFIIEVILCTKGILFAGGEQKLKRAKKEGKFVLGTLKNSWYKIKSGNQRKRRQIGCIPEFTSIP